MSTQSKIKILLLDQADFIGGAELFNLDLINQIDRNQFEVFLLFSGNSAYQKKIKQSVNEYIYKIPQLRKGIFKYWNLLRSALMLKLIIKREGINIIQSNTIRMHGIAAFTKKIFKLKVKLVWFIHDFTFPAAVLQKLYLEPDLILACSKSVQSDLLQKLREKNLEKIHIAYNGIDLSLLKPRSSEKKSKTRIGIIGRLDPWKGQDVFIQAAEKVLTKNQTVDFFIIGEASQYDEATVRFKKKITMMVKANNLTANIHFLGYVEDVYTAMNQLDIVVHASIKPEPFGRVILEAMALCKVVIASALGGPQEIIKDTVDGFLIEPNNPEILADKILSLINEPSLMQKIGQNARQTIQQKYQLSAQVDKIEAEWKNLLNSKT